MVSKHQSLDQIPVQGRWLAHKTARIYINEGLEVLARTQVDFQDPSLRSFLQIYQSIVSNPHLSTLEPPAKAGRVGGRGKDKECRGRKRVKKCIFLCQPGFTTIFLVTSS